MDYVYAAECAGWPSVSPEITHTHKKDGDRHGKKEKMRDGEHHDIRHSPWGVTNRYAATFWVESKNCADWSR